MMVVPYLRPATLLRPLEGNRFILAHC